MRHWHAAAVLLACTLLPWLSCDSTPAHNPLKPERHVLVEQLHKASLTLPDKIFRKGYKSDVEARRWPLFLSKLAQPGANITIGAFGGSVTVGYSKSVTTSYTEEFVKWLQSSFPSAKFKLVNQARRATAASFAALCLLQDMPTDPSPDLILVEYSANGFNGQCQCFTSAQVSGYEVLLRKVIRRHPDAALISLASFLWDTTPGTAAPFYQTGEDQQNVVARYYGVPMMSARDAFWHYFNIEPVNAYHLNRSTVLADIVHPSDTGCRHYAGLLAWYVKHAAARLPVHLLAAGVALRQLGSHGLPPPLNNDTAQENTKTFCTAGLQLKDAAAVSTGWEFVDEGNNACEGCHKYGWMSQDPGSVLQLKLDTNLLDGDAKAAASSAEPETLSMIVSYLLSYQHMGKATLECVGGCKCNSTTMDAFQTKKRTSEITSARLGITAASDCQLKFTVLEETSSKGHKFRLAGVAVHKTDKVLSYTYAPVYD